jgi:nucleoside-diphosphate-sugar epimerase
MKKSIFIAGAGGYIGSKMTGYFLEKGHFVTALDRFFFGETLSFLRKHKHLKILKDDIRFFDKSMLKNVDVVINLASISNDPASELKPEVTKMINLEGAVRLGKLSKIMKVKRYIFASSCSVYGAGSGTLNEESKTTPLSEYARSKIAAEHELLKLADSKFNVIVLRLATVYGLSKMRMRFDLLVNLMTLHAWKNRKIFILGGGKQWRPLIHIDDCIRAFDLVANARKNVKVNKQIFNVGSNAQNYQVFQVANILKKHFPEVSLEITPDDPDQRSYKVNFDKFAKYLMFKPKKTIDDGVREVRSALEKGEIIDDIKTNTSWYYRYLIDADNTLSSVKLKGQLF